MNRFENLTHQEVADIITNRANLTLLISKKLSQTEIFPNGNVPMGMPYLSEKSILQILAHSSMNGNDVKTRWTTFILISSYIGGVIKYVNLDGDDCEISIEFRNKSETTN